MAQTDLSDAVTQLQPDDRPFFWRVVPIRVKLVFGALLIAAPGLAMGLYGYVWILREGNVEATPALWLAVSARFVILFLVLVGSFYLERKIVAPHKLLRLSARSLRRLEVTHRLLLSQ